MESSGKDHLSDEIDAAIARVREVQRKRTLASAAGLAVALVIVVGGEALVVWMVGNANRFPVMIFALPFVVGLPPAWAVRQGLWPKDPVI